MFNLKLKLQKTHKGLKFPKILNLYLQSINNVCYLQIITRDANFFSLMLTPDFNKAEIEVTYVFKSCIESLKNEQGFTQAKFLGQNQKIFLTSSQNKIFLLKYSIKNSKIEVEESLDLRSEIHASLVDVLEFHANKLVHTLNSILLVKSSTIIDRHEFETKIIKIFHGIDEEVLVCTSDNLVYHITVTNDKFVIKRRSILYSNQILTVHNLWTSQNGVFIATLEYF